MEGVLLRCRPQGPPLGLSPMGVGLAQFVAPGPLQQSQLDVDEMYQGEGKHLARFPTDWNSGRRGFFHAENTLHRLETYAAVGKTCF